MRPDQDEDVEASDHVNGSRLAPPFIRVRLINIDHVCVKPGPHDRADCAFLPAGEQLPKVPVLRIFGATPNGQRVCLHIHGVFPYCYIPYTGSLEPDYVLHYISRLGGELNAAITASLRSDSSDRARYYHIAAIHLVKGVPFYGFHVGWRYYLKISFVDPSHNFRLATILQSGRVMRTAFQPHEIHIRYQLQWMLDYNIFGCDYIDLEQAHFRLPLPEARATPPDLDIDTQRWDETSVPPHLIREDAPRTSFCDLEIDGEAKHVLNRRKLRGRNLHHDFDEDESRLGDQKLVPSLTGLWEEEKQRRLKAGLSATPPAPTSSKEKQRAYAHGESPEWMAESRFRQLLEARLTMDAQGAKKAGDFTRRHPLDGHISTTFESVEFFHYAPGELAGPRNEATQMPSTLYNLEHSQSPQKRATRGDEATAETLSQLDADFFSTQAFQSDIAALERQHVEDHEDDDELIDGERDEKQEPAGGVASQPGTPRTPRTPRKRDATDGSAAATTPTLPPRSAFKTPSRALATQSAAVRFASPLKRQRGSQESDGDVEEISQPTSSPRVDFPSSLPLSLTPRTRLPPSQQDDVDDAAPAPTMGSPNWFSAHLRAQTRWREQAHSQAGVKKAGGSDSSQVAPTSTVPALTQIAKGSAATSSHTSDSAPVQPSIVARERNTWAYVMPAPSKIEVTASMSLFGLAPVEYQDPYYSNPRDVPGHAREYAGRSWRFASKTIRYLPDFPVSTPASARAQGGEARQCARRAAQPNCWQYGPPPPTRANVEQWARAERRKRRRIARYRAQMASQSNATQTPSFGFKISQRTGGKKDAAHTAVREKQHMTILAIEVQVNTRGELLPDPKKDRIEAIAYSFQNEDESLDDTGSRPGLRTGLLILDDSDEPLRADRLGLSHLPFTVVDSELELFNTLVDVVRQLDPEILVGYEIHNGSWGYVIDRARHELGYDLVPELSRVNSLSTGMAGGKADNWGWTQTSALKVTGRHILNIWRLMRGELNLNQYTYENVVFHLLRSRVPRFPPTALSQWYRSRRPHQVSRVLRYWIERAETDLLILETSELVFRTAEFARIYGVDFFSVISRGSQFKVESVMFRIAKPESFVLPSPNTKQVAEQNAAECLPLIMEPQSAFYKGPLLVLDFQSLYPSVMIAYNICYSTCLGRVGKFAGTDKFGITDLTLPKGLLTLLQDDVNISANGLIYVKPHVRRSLLAKMLNEILETRVMVKSSVKGRKSDKAFVRLQNARQLSLKLLANVTYGYTSATFSGRMPCVEIADSIVQYGRETLEKAIALIHGKQAAWGAQVVYGDTDSLFIYLPGKSKDDAFRIGNEIADEVTAMNPSPIKLKFEKVYLPSVLLAKKRYVGFKYEAPDDIVPEFNAKGIETVRRDGFPALQRMLEACIRILFTSADLSLVKRYCQRQWISILRGDVSLQQFVIAKEVRLGGYSANGVPPPGAAVSTRRMLLDARSEPQHAERVPYLITQGEPRAKLNDVAVGPEVMLANPALQLGAGYYITRGIIPPLTRVFNLLGADVESWWREMPKPTMNDTTAPTTTTTTSPSAASRLTLTDHYRPSICLCCSRRTTLPLCLDCLSSPASTLLAAHSAHANAQRRLEAVESVCRHCSRMTAGGMGGTSPCVSTDCPVQWEREGARRRERRQAERCGRIEIALEEGV